MTKERQILFKDAMVRAILNGTKTQTRRVSGLDVINASPDRYKFVGVSSGPGEPHYAFHDQLSGAQTLVRCKSGQPGELLWVKETFYAWGRWETRYSENKGRDEWHFVDLTLECGKSYVYASSGEPEGFKRGRRRRGGIHSDWWQRPSIFMPRIASRITLEITAVRVERLQDISVADALAEGVNVHPDHHGKPRESIYSPVQAYQDLWESINGPDSWEANPWVGAISFRKV